MRRLPVRPVLRVIGAGLLVASAAVHLDLYVTGYGTIPTIGWLFLVQVIVGFALGVTALVSGSRVVAAAGALFALGTLGGFLITVQFGLFGFREVRTTAGIVAGIFDVLAFAALAVLALTPSTSGARAAHAATPAVAKRWLGPVAAGVSGRRAGIGVGVASVVAFGLLAGVLAGAIGGTGVIADGQAAGGLLRTNDVGGKTLLANTAGRTVYYFAADSVGKTTCYGSCALYWTPVAGPLAAGPGVTGKLGTIKRNDGIVQETYGGHPLYTYVGDSGPAQTNGNNINLNGGFWYYVPVRG